MSEGYSYGPRVSHRLPEALIAGRPRPRESQPPLGSGEVDVSGQSSRTVKQPSTSGFQSRYQRSSDTKNEPRPSITSYNNAHTSYSTGGESHSPTQSPTPKNIHQYTSPKSDSVDWTGKNAQNRSMPNGSRIDKQAYLSKAEGGNPPLTRLNSMGYENGRRESSDHFATKQSPQMQQHSPLLKKSTPTPRFSQLGFVSSEDENIDMGGSKQLITSNDSRYSKKEETKKIGSRTMIQMNSEKEGFRKNKEIKGDSIVGNYSTLESRKMRQSEFRHSDFMKGKELGTGKFGKVQVVKHIKTGFVCAMKTVPKSIIRQENIINQFIRQVKIQSCLDHPNIAKLYGFFEDKDNIYLLLELGYEGQLYRLMKQRQRFNETTTVYIIRQLCEAIKYLHNLHILHRDIKPQNIVVAYGTMKLCDFGWAVCKGTELRSTFCGTPLYVSPEILKGQLYDEKIDVWAIGILTYQLLVGDIPFQIGSEQQLVKIIKEDIVFPADLPITPEAKDFVLKILKKNPDQRLKVEKLLEHPFLRRHLEPHEIEL